ncbi:MAG: hypothetical protein ACI4NX_07270 [Megasphaera elsdenii]|uniref:hypothetical protein n=1 Tax=Megasphaera elsdenii TaxID=907 RepID=UPI003EFDC078
MNTRASQAMTMSLIEIITTQHDIINAQNTLIYRLAQCAGQIEGIDEEMKRINELKERIEAKP